MKRKLTLLISITISIILSMSSNATDNTSDSKDEVLGELSNILVGSLCEQNSFTMVCTNNAENCKSHMLKRINICNQTHSKELWAGGNEPDIQNWINVVYSCVQKGYLDKYRDSVKQEQGCLDALQYFE